MEHLLENRVCILEKLSMQTELLVQTLGDICNISVNISYDVLLVILFKLRLHSLHFIKAVVSLNKPNKHYPVINLRVHLDN